jgi:nitrile hydratase accessory protein
MDDAPAPVFEEPWHAQVFAITVALNEAGVLQWTDWADRFGATLKQQGLTRDLNGGSDYFHAWIETLEDFIADQKIALPYDLEVLKSAWEQAYLQTPHGQPVKIQRL